MRSKLLVLALLLSGCAAAPVVTSNLVTPPVVSVPVIAPTNLQPVSFQLATASTYAAFSDCFKADPNAHFYILSQADMNNLVGNIQEMRRYILSQQASITYLSGVLDLYTKPVQK